MMNSTQTKTTQRQREALEQLHNRGGAVISSDWTNGAGRFTTSKAIPPFCKKIDRSELRWNEFPQRITKVFERHPRCQSVVAIVDMRAARKVLREGADQC